MIWSSNYARLGCATMFTLFLAGNDVAPRTSIEGVPVQDYLQDHFIKAMVRVARRSRGSTTWPATTRSTSRARATSAYPTSPASGAPTRGARPHAHAVSGHALGLRLPTGSQRVGPRHSGYRQVGTQLVNPDGVSVWREGFRDVWQENGVWEDGTLLRPDTSPTPRTSPRLPAAVRRALSRGDTRGRSGGADLRGGRSRRADTCDSRRIRRRESSTPRTGMTCSRSTPRHTGPI